jgi:UDP-glucose 4-epimerase
LVVGGMGFIGSAVCRQLAALGYRVCVLDNESKGSCRNLEGVRVQVYRADILAGEVGAIVQSIQPSAVIHLAAMHFIPECNQDPARCLEVNVAGTEHVLAACRNARSTRVVLASSMAVYPISDEAHREIDPVRPTDVYGESKATNERQARRFHEETGITTVAVRLSNCYGPRETNAHVIPEIMKQLAAGASEVRLGNVDVCRDFLHVDDAARGLTALAVQPLEVAYHVVNLSAGQEYSVRRVLVELSNILGREIRVASDPDRIRPAERQHLLGDRTLMRGLAGWEPSVALRDGLAALCEWHGIK